MFLAQAIQDNAADMLTDGTVLTGCAAHTYSVRLEDQFHGPGQGATDRPFCWAILSTMIIYAFNRRAQGCTLADPTGTITWKRAVDMFVDDAYLFHVLAALTSAMAIMVMVQHDLLLWAKLLWVTGGAINFAQNKTFYSVLICYENSNQTVKPTWKLMMTSRPTAYK